MKRQVAIVDMENLNPKTNRFKVIKRVSTVRQAEQWISKQDPKKVQRGGYNIN